MNTSSVNHAARPPAVLRGRLGFFLLLVAAILLVPLALSGSAQALKYTYPASKSLGINTLKGSKGYKVSLYVSTYGKTKSVQLSATKGAANVYYSTKPSKLTSKVIKASFGKFGSVSLKFKATGKPKKEAKVKGCAGKRTVSTKGILRGKVKFTGSHHFTSVNVKKVGATFYKNPKRTCHYPKPHNPPNTGKTTSFSISPHYGSGKNWNFSASKTAKGHTASYSFYSSAKFGKVSVTESISGQAPKSTFTSNAGATVATIKPPAPFKGSATGDSTGSSLTGSLKVKSALEGTVKLTGPSLSFYLSEY